MVRSFWRMHPIQLVVEAYIVLLVGCIAFHLLALLISMALGRGVSAIAVLPFLVFVAFTSVDFFTGQNLYPGICCNMGGSSIKSVRCDRHL